MSKMYRFLLILCLGISAQTFGQNYTLTNPQVVNTFPYTDTGVNTTAGSSAIGMQGSCSALPCCSVYVYKVILPSAGVLRVEMSNFVPLQGSIIAYRPLVATPTAYSDLSYIGSTVGNFCGFRDSLQLGRGVDNWKAVPYGQAPAYNSFTSIYDFNAPSSSAGFFPAGDYYILIFNRNNQFGVNLGLTTDLYFEFAEACAPLTTPPSLVFDTLEPNAGMETLSFYIKNDRTQDVVIDTSALSIDGADNSMFSVLTYPDTNLAVGDSTLMSVVFNPSSGGLKAANLNIQFADTVCSASSTVSLSGVGAEPNISISGNGIIINNGDNTPSINDNTNLGALVSNTGSISKSFTILNQGSDTLTLNGSPLVSLVGSSEFMVTNSPASNLLPGASTSFTITYTPNSIGLDTVELSILNNDAAKSNYQFRLYGTGAGLNGLNFDGSGDYVNINTVSSGMTGATAFTVETWIKVAPGQSGNDAIVGVNTSSNGTRMLLWLDDGILEFHVGSTSKVISSQNMRDDAWHNLVFVFDNGTLDFYLDGVPTSTITNNIPAFAATDKWSIGQEYDNGGASDFLLASLDEFRLWKIARTYQEILDARYCEISNPSADLLAYYTFNQGVPDGDNSSLSSLTDWSGSGLDGILNGFSLNGTNSNFVATSNVGTNCTSFNSTICDANSYVSPSGKTYTSSGLYVDTIPKTMGGDSLLYIDLQLNYQSFSQNNIPDTIACVNDTVRGSEMTTNLVSIMELDNSNSDWVEINEIRDSLINTNRSIFMWMRAAGTISGSQDVLVGINTSGTGTVTNFGIATNEQLWINDGGSNRNSGVTVTDGNWHFVGYTYNESSNSTQFWVDGVAAASFTNGQSISATSRISIGQEFDGSSTSNFFDGDITEVSFWNEVLDSTDIAAIMQAAIKSTHPKHANLIGYYPSNSLCQDGINVLRDYSGNDLHGELSSRSILNKDSLVAINNFNAADHFNFNLNYNGSSLSASNPYSFIFNSAGVYSAQLSRDFVEITDDFNVTLDTSCAMSLQVNITINSLISCNGYSNGGATASVSNGSSPYTYLWSNSATIASITGVVAGTYTVTVTENGGATTTDMVTITEPTLLSAGVSVDSSTSCNGSADGGATASAIGGTSPYTYAWSNSATTASITGVVAGTYTVSISDANGCTSTSSSTITQPVALIAITTLDSNDLGTGGGATASATGGTAPYNYIWSNAATTATITGVGAGTYTVSITDNNGCTDSEQITIIAGPVPTVVIDSTVSCNGLSNGGATASVVGGTIPYTYAWSNSASTASITGVVAGTYTVTVSDNNGITATNSATIIGPASFIAASIVDSTV
ncbi:MAG: choice-of-anchor D domain-containing protein, partial [Flavobacteriales bacterium]|nr:choice-of-anchor D domain-containing protein [Flavobacteriales bacterium]